MRSISSFISSALPFFPRFPTGELGEFYLSVGLRTFALGLIGIFEPIYIFLQFGKSLPLTLLYFGIASIVFGVLVPLGGRICARLGAKRTIVASIPFAILYYGGLWLLPTFISPLFVLLLIFSSAARSVVYWPAYHIHFTRISTQESRGRNISSAVITSQISSLAAPLIGGLCIAAFGFSFVFGLVVGILMLSGIPLMRSSDVRPVWASSLADMVRLALASAQRAKSISFAALGIELSMRWCIWPLFLFLLAINFETMGLLASAALFASIVFTRYIGNAIDKRGAAYVLRIGIIANALMWPLKAFISSPLQAFAVQTAHEFTSSATFVPLDAFLYNWWSRHPSITPVRLIVLREMMLNTFGGLALLGLAGLFLFTDNLTIAFWIAAGASLFIMFVKK